MSIIQFYCFLSIFTHFYPTIFVSTSTPKKVESCISLAKLAESTTPKNDSTEWSLAGKCAKESLKVAKLPEESMNMPSIIKYYGYRLDTTAHIVNTSDGYRLTLFRILPRKNSGPTNSNFAKPVLLQHGVFGSSTAFIYNLPHQSLAYILADNGYDVWLSNSRGTTYSSNHQTFTEADAKFWDFTWQDMAHEDLPAIVNHILKVTGRKRLAYIGHSQGTLIAFAKFSADPVFASEKINHFFALAPVATVEHVKCPPRIAMTFVKTLQRLVSTNYFSMPNDKIQQKLPSMCKNDELKKMCSNTLFDFCGPQSRDNINQTRIDIYLKIAPDRTSIKNVIHFGQMANHGRMQKYNYLTEKLNSEKYGQKTPPEYKLENLQLDTTLFYSPIDALGTEEDLFKLLKKVPSLKLYRVPDYSHMDFLWALNAKDKVYDKIIAKLNELEF